MKLNQIYHCDSLHFIHDMEEESIDFIYIDPPFGTESLWPSKAFKQQLQELAFYNSLRGVKGYINFMMERLIHMHRPLKKTGILFLHLDWRMSHYIRTRSDLWSKKL